MEQQSMHPYSTTPLRRVHVGNVELAYTEAGTGEPILFIHGSWDDHHSWNGVAEILHCDFRTITYDRRGHSASTAPPGQGCLSEDVEDALNLLDKLNISPAHIVGHSYGANVAIALASRAPDATRSLFVHEPPLFSLLTGAPELDELRREAAGLMKGAAELLEAGDIEAGAKLFIERVAFGPCSWETLFDEGDRRIILANADTWLDQFRDPERLSVDVTQLRNYPHRATFSTGTASLQTYRETTHCIAAVSPAFSVVEIPDGAHGAHISHPEQIASAIKAHIAAAGKT